MPESSTVDRPYGLWVYDEDTEQWNRWSTYREHENAVQRAEHLAAKGIIATATCPCCQQISCVME